MFEAGDFIEYENSGLNEEFSYFEDDLDWGFGLILLPGSYVSSCSVKNLIEPGWYYPILRITPVDFCPDGVEWMRQDCLDAIDPYDFPCLDHYCDGCPETCYIHDQIQTLRQNRETFAENLPLPSWKTPKPNVQAPQKVLTPKIQIAAKPRIIQPQVQVASRQCPAIGSRIITPQLRSGSTTIRPQLPQTIDSSALTRSED